MHTAQGFSSVIGLEYREREDGRAEASFEAGDEHLNPGGTVHGGAIATLVDSAMGLAANAVTEEDKLPVTVEMKVTYLEPGAPGRVVATAQVRKAGKRVI